MMMMVVVVVVMVGVCLCDHLTFNNLVVGKVKVEQEEHVEQSQCPTEEQTRGLTHCSGQQSRNLRGDHTNHFSTQLRGKRG